MNLKKTFSFIFILSMVLVSCKEATAPAPVLPIPQAKQVSWQKMETYAFIHFGPNTFNDMEWGYGDADPKSFNPTKLDCEQWARTFVNAGLKGVIITAKHHDGFCLWPSKYTEYSVKNSSFRDGKGDVLRELAEACKKYNLKLGLYLSPWDRNHANYGTPEYVEYFYNQLEELLTSYGDLFEVWFDGANGGDGYYGGAKERRRINRKNYYDFPRAHRMIKKYQPNAVIFSDEGPGCRWVGNEQGFAGATNWSFLRSADVYPGYAQYQELQYGHEDGDTWIPSECNTSIRPGWFYHESQDSKVKSPEHLLDLYYRNVGHNGTFLLNFPVNKEGLIHPIDSANAVKFHQMVLKDFEHNLLAEVKVKASNTRGKAFAPANVLDEDFNTYWSTDDDVNKATLSFTFEKDTQLNRLLLQEYIPLGQRVKSFVVEYQMKNKEWQPVTLNEETTTIGYKRILRFKKVNTKAIRIRFLEARGPLCINNVEAFLADDIEMNYETSISSIKGFDFKVINSSDEQSSLLMDKDESTFWVNTDSHDLVIDLGKEKSITEFHYLPNQEKKKTGLISNYELYSGSSASNVNMLIKRGEFSNIKNNPILQSLYFSPVKARYLRLKAARMISEKENPSYAEVVVK